jgi:hypothetical protein
VAESFDFSMYDGKKSDAVFCESYRNINDQQYYKQTARARNVCLVEGAEDEVITVGDAQGLERREAYIRAGRYAPQDLGEQFLRQNEPVESLDVKIVNPYTPFEYKKDYDVGDIVTIISQSYGVEITRNILEVTEFFDRSGFHLYVVFGSIPRDLLMELQNQDNRLDELERAPDIDFDMDELLVLLIDLVIPELVNEVFDKIEFPPFPDFLSEEEILKLIEDALARLLKDLGGSGNHVIIDRLPSQAEINTFPLNAEVLVYNPNQHFTPSS